MSLKKYQNEKGIVEIILPGFIGDEPYTFEVDLENIKYIFELLKDMLHNPQDRFYYLFKDIKRENHYVLGYQPAEDYTPMGCGFFYIMHGNEVLGLGFTNHEKFVKDVYLGLKAKKDLKLESMEVEDYFTGKELLTL